MFGGRYFGSRYWGRKYWSGGTTVVVTPGPYWGPEYFGGRYWGKRYFPGGIVTPPVDVPTSLIGAIEEAYVAASLVSTYGKCYTRRAKPGEEPPQVMLSVKKGDWFYHSTDTKIRDYRCAFKVRSLTGQGAYEGAKALASLFPDESHLEWNGGHTGPIYQTEWSDDVESKLGPKNTTVFTCQMSFCVRVIGVR